MSADAPEDWRTRATLSIPEAAAILGLGRNGAYAAAKRGEIPTVRFGGRIFVSVHHFRALLGEVMEVES